MDSSQVASLRHKSHIVASNVQLDESNISELTSRKLVNKAILENFKDDLNNFNRMVKYLEQLESNPPGIAKGAFDRLCDFLERCTDDVDLQWISDELRTELKTVRGELIVENYIRAEAQMLVDAEFGHIRRLTQLEKVDMAKLLALRMQHYKEVWKRAITEGAQKLAEMNRILAEKTSHQQRIIDKIRQYVRVHDNLLQRSAGATESAPAAANIPVSSSTDVTGDEDALSPQLSALVGILKAMADNNLQARQSARDEKYRALQVIGVGDVNKKLDVEVVRVLEPVDRDLSDVRATLNSQLQRNDKLREELSRLERERDGGLRDCDEQMRQLNGRLTTAERQGRDLKADMHRLQQRVTQTRARVGKYKVKNQVMNDVRNLGYVNGKAGLIEKVDESDRMTTHRKSVFDVKPPGGSGGVLLAGRRQTISSQSRPGASDSRGPVKQHRSASY